MKVYLRGYQVKKEFAQALKAGTAPNHDIYDVWFSKEPEWTFVDHYLAQGELNLVTGMSVHVGQHHYCKFELEALADDKYALACNDHPPLGS